MVTAEAVTFPFYFTWLAFLDCEACQGNHPVCLAGCQKAPIACRGVSPHVKVVLKRCPPPKE